MKILSKTICYFSVSNIIILSWAIFGPKPQLGFAAWGGKVASSISRWMWNGGHRAWSKSPVTFLRQVRESEPRPPRRATDPGPMTSERRHVRRSRSAVSSNSAPHCAASLTSWIFGPGGRRRRRRCERRRDGPLGWRVGLGGSLAVGRGAGR